MSTSYKKYSSNNGLSTYEWGPSAWHFLFCTIMGSYPYKIDENNKEDIQIKNSFKMMFASIRYTLPCCVCNESYRRYWEEIPIDDYLVGRIELMKWLYLIKDQVNKKLIFQENEKLKIEKQKLIDKYKIKDIKREDFNKQLKKIKDKICITRKSNSFNSVLEYYESFRAKTFHS